MESNFAKKFFFGEFEWEKNLRFFNTKFLRLPAIVYQTEKHTGLQYYTMVVNVNSKTFSFKLIPILVLINFSEPISHTKCFTLKDVLIIINYCDLLYCMGSWKLTHSTKIFTVCPIKFWNSFNQETDTLPLYTLNHS